MKKLINPILIFILIQLAWVGMLVLWIYWYIDKHQLIKDLARKYQPILLEKSFSGTWLILLEGSLLMLLILTGIYFIFVFYLKLHTLNLLQNNFISSVTHELKSPLASIQLYLETMKFKELSLKDKQTFIDYMLKDTERLSCLINNILKANQFEKKVIKYNFIETDLKVFLRKYFDYQHNLTPDSYTINVQNNKDFKCAIDNETFTYAINNMVDNAIKYNRKKLLLELSLSSDKKNCYIEFKDNGIGIEKEYQKKIFNKFYRIGDEMKRTDMGTGLGLFLVNKIIRSHKGKITVISQGKDAGSNFKITLPKIKNKKVFPKLLRKEI